MSLLLSLVGCIYVSHTVPVGDSGTDSGWRPMEEGEMCTSDAQCSGTFACQGWVTGSTDGHGCVERCLSDWDCKAGSNCLDDGSCG